MISQLEMSMKNHLRTLNTVVLAKTRQIGINLLMLLLVNVLGLQVISNLIEITSVSSGTLLTIVITDTMMSSLATKSIPLSQYPMLLDPSIDPYLPISSNSITKRERGRKIFNWKKIGFESFFPAFIKTSHRER